MKICMITPFPSNDKFETVRMGNRYSINLVDALIENRDKGFSITIFANMLDHEKQLEYKCVKIKRLWHQGRINPFKLFKEIVKIKPDVVHIQYVLGAKYGKGPYLLNPFLFMLFLRIARCQLLITIHDIIPLNKLYCTFKEMFKNHPVSSFLYSVSYRLATTFMCKVASKIIILDQGTKKWAIEQYGYSKNKITIIPHGMLKEAEYITAKQAKKALGINEKWNVLLFFGKIHPRKGIEYTIKALPYVLKKHPNTLLLIAGSYSNTWKKESKSYVYLLKQMTKSLGIENRTLFEIKFFGKEIPMIFGAADIVLLPYAVPYGASGVIKLAATYRKLVITPNSKSREGEITDRISGILLPFLDEKILAQKINKLLENKLLSRNMGDKFYEENLKSSEWKKVAKETLECYKTAK